MFKGGGDQDRQDVNYSLICAVREGRLEIARELINSFGLSYSQEWSEGYVLLCDALENKHAAVAKLLLTSGSRVNSINKMPSYTPLHFAVINGNIEIVKMILDKGANVDTKDQNGRTPLHNAAEIGCLQTVEHLLKYGAYVDCVCTSIQKDSYTPLHFAVEKGNEEAVKLLLNRGADINASTKGNLTPLHIATRTGHETVVKLLLQHGANVESQDKDSKTILHFAVERGNLTIVKDVLKYCPDIYDKGNRSSLKIAVHGYGGENKKIVEALLEYGLMVNPQDKNNPELLHAAVEKGYLKIIEDLLKYGADVNMLNNSKYSKGLTPLHRAAKYKQEEIAKLLISYEADVNAQDVTGKTPIFYAIENDNLNITKLLLTNEAKIKDSPELLNTAVKNGCIEIIETILKYGADINSRDEHGRTALHIAAKEGHNKVVVTLLEYGADINITNSDSKTPLDLALGGTETLKRHIVKMKTANLYVSKKNLLSMRRSELIHQCPCRRHQCRHLDNHRKFIASLSDFKDECEKEIASMKSEKINNLNISFYDILAKGTRSSAIYMRNKNIVQVLKSDDYKTKFPIYTSMIKTNFRKGMERKELLEQSNEIIHFLFINFPELPYNCTERVFSYLSDADLRILIDACKPLGICNPN